ncbi:MAG: carboxypeptidase-like regulatory domain-containing protein, partial [Gemmatimonadales bacterium]
VSASCARAGRVGEAASELGAAASPGAPAGRVMSDPAGHFVLKGLEAGTTCVVRAEQPYGSAGVVRDVRPGDDVVVSLPAVGTLRGTAVGSDGRPVERFSLTLTDDATGEARTENVLASSGRWSVGQVRPGRLHIVASDGARNAPEQTVQLDPGGAADGIRLELQPWGGAVGSNP